MDKRNACVEIKCLYIYYYCNYNNVCDIKNNLALQQTEVYKDFKQKCQYCE